MIPLAWTFWPRAYEPNLTAARGEHVFNAFLKIGEDGHIAMVVPQCEMGQGVTTLLPQIMADELGADWRTIAVETAQTGPILFPARNRIVGRSFEFLFLFGLRLGGRGDRGLAGPQRREWSAQDDSRQEENRD